jgi:hypothetical protein
MVRQSHGTELASDANVLRNADHMPIRCRVALLACAPLFSKISGGVVALPADDSFFFPSTGKASRSLFRFPVAFPLLVTSLVPARTVLLTLRVRLG